MLNRRHERSWRSATAMVALLGLVWVGCHDHSETPTAPESQGLTLCEASNVLYPSNFSDPTHIDNRWFPLVPGMQFILDGVANRGGGPLPHRVVLTVTDLTKEISGVRTVVLWDRDYNAGELQEAELAFHAQDNEGNVWNLGEYPEEYERGEFVGAPNTWIAALAGAEAGILVTGTPEVGVHRLQGWAPDINFLDCGMVFTTGVTTCVPFNCYENVLVIDEWSPFDHGNPHQRKYYAPGVGNVQIGAVNDPEGETLVLVNVLHLSPQVLAEARVEALKLESRAYRVSEVYSLTPPAR